MWTIKILMISFLRFGALKSMQTFYSLISFHSNLTRVVLWGIQMRQKGCFFYNKSENKVFLTRNGVFFEKKFISKKTMGSNIYLEVIRRVTNKKEKPLPNAA